MTIRRLRSAVTIFGLCFSLLLTSCLEKNPKEPIGEHVAFPVRMLNVSDHSYLLLNSNAANSYAGGSIQRYTIDPLGNSVLTNTYPIIDHGSDIALTDDLGLLALSFDGSKTDTQILFYDYSDSTQLTPLENLTLNFTPTEGKQSIKQLKFFRVEGYTDYFLYGVILTSPLDTGEGKYIPARTFVAQISADRTESKILFVLSYGVGDEKNNAQTLAPKSDSLKYGFGPEVVQYMLGSTAPMFDPHHQFFLAFPTGSMNGFNDEAFNIVPQLPSALEYFSARSNPSDPCSVNEPNCTHPDLRAVSLFAVDMQSLLSGTPLNLALYFVPMAWNSNGIPFGHKTNGAVIEFGAGNSEDVTSFKFQSDFWDSYLLDNNNFLVAKKGAVVDKDSSSGNEIFQISGLDILAENIQKIKKFVVADPSDSNDFKLIAHRQMIDSFHLLNNSTSDLSISANWPVNPITHIQNPAPLVPYMFSRTLKEDGKEAFIKAPTAAYGFDTACVTNNDSSSVCFPYWIRATYLGLGNPGRDTSWLTTNIPSPSYHLGDSPVFQDALVDPTGFTSFEFTQLSGAQVCTTLQKKDIYCASFLTGEFTKFHFTLSGFVPF